jgi:anti-sigma factor RsiW
MDYCEYSEKVSELIDGQLASEEIEKVKVHLIGCQACKEMHEAFLETRGTIRTFAKSLTRPADRHARDRILRDGIGRPTTLWTGSIRLPIPVAVVMAVIMIGLAVWSVLSNTARRGFEPTRNSVGQTRPTGELVSGQSDLARFDRGGRAVIYKERRSSGELNRQ